jgi:Phage tail tube protein
MAYGQSGHLGVTFQESFGTSFTGSAFYVPLISERIAEKIDQLVESNVYGRLSEPPTHEGTHEIGGEIRSEAQPVTLGVWLRAALGQAASTLQDSVYVHEFLPAAADWDAFAALPPLTLELHRDAGSAFLYSDMLAASLTLEVAHGQLLGATVDMLGGRFERQAASVPAFHAGRPWTWDVVSASYDGAGIADFRKLSVVFDNRLATQFALTGGKLPHRIKRGGPQQVRVEGSFLLENDLLFNEYVEQSEKRLLVVLTGEAVSSGYNATLTLDIPRLRLSEVSPQLSGPGQLEVSFSGAGVYDTTSGYALRATLTNTQAAY